MFAKLLNFIKNIDGKDFRIFLLFLLISVLVWQIEKLRQTFPEDTSLNIKCENVPEGYVTPPSLDKSVRVRLEGNGFSLLRMYLTNDRNVRVNVSSLNKFSSDGKTWAVFITRRLNGQKTDLPEHVRIAEVFTDTVFIPLLTVKRRKLPIIVRDEVSLMPQYVFSSQRKVIPDSVTVTATSDVMDTIRAIYTEVQDPMVLNDTMRLEVPLILPEMAEASSKSAILEYDVEPFAEKKLLIPIQPINVASGYSCKIFPPNARVSFNVGLSKFEDADESCFRVIADFSNIRPGDNVSRVRLSLTKSPDFIQNVSFSPSFAEFILQKNKK